jgi:hypothetical protein
MTIPTLMLWLLSASGLLVAMSALFVARRSSDLSLRRQLNALSERLLDQEDSLVAVTARQKSIHVRLSNMTRGKSASDATNGDRDPHAATTEDDKDRWQRETNLKIAQGLFRR